MLCIHHSDSPELCRRCEKNRLYPILILGWKKNLWHRKEKILVIGSTSKQASQLKFNYE